MEQDIKKNLSDLSKIPQKEFEKHFSEWMARDDVARSLQANLRSDLIKNFNKTHLGKQILSQTSNTTGIYGAPTQRLTLSPLILALNTLVAEFLYAQNCHFSLSVFCTEIPFRNTLPDFESSRCFRFTEPEVVDIFKALSADANSRKDLRKCIAKDYAESPTSSLLLLILKNLLELQKLETFTQGTITEEPEVLNQKPQSNEANTDAEAAQQATHHDAKTEIFNTNFRYLNKYLIVLSKKVKEMTQRIDNLQQRHAEPSQATMQANSQTLPRPRSRKSVGRRKFENLNRSLERISENLKQMTLSKRKSKRITTIVTAVDTMAKQLEKCAANFEEVSKNLLKREEPKSTVNIKPTVAMASAATATEEMPPLEKTYTDWVHEMRTTTNGEKFLSRIEISLNKALRKQRDQLQNESELKLRHQKELLKIRYKQKLFNHLNKFSHESAVGETNSERQNVSIEQQLKLFEKKHYELLNKIRDAEKNAARQPGATKTTQMEPETSTKLVKETELPMVPSNDNQHQNKVYENHSEPVPKPKPHNLQDQNKRFSEDTLQMRRKWEEMLNRTVIEDKYVEHIVCDARLRIRELENESNQLEQSFRNYLERQRLLKESSREAAQKMWDSYSQEKQKIEEKYRLVKENIKRQEKQRKRKKRLKYSDIEEDESEEDTNSEQQKNRLKNNLTADRCRLEAGAHDTDLKSKKDTTIVVPRNAILEARDKLFDKESKLRSFHRLDDLERTDKRVNNKDIGMNLIFMRAHTEAKAYESEDVVDEMANAVLNSTFTELNGAEHHRKLEYKFNISSSSNDSLNGPMNVDKNVQLSHSHHKAELKQKKYCDEIEQQQSAMASGYHKAVKDSVKHLDESEKKPHKSCIQNKSNVNKENDEQQQQQLLKRPSSIDAASCQMEDVPIDTTTKLMMMKTTATTSPTSMTLKSKTVPTSLVLQQSMAKMNKLFGEEQQRRETTESRANKRTLKTTAATKTATTAAITTATTATKPLTQQQQQQQSNLLVEIISHVDDKTDSDDGVGAAAAHVTAVAAPIVAATRRHSIAELSAANKVENKNFNEIEKNNTTETTIVESMATLKRALVGQKQQQQQQQQATKSQQQQQQRQRLHNINNGNEAQALNIDNGRVDGNKRQQEEQQQQESQQQQQQQSIQHSQQQNRSLQQSIPQPSQQQHNLEEIVKKTEKIRQQQMIQDTQTPGQLSVKISSKLSHIRVGASDKSNIASSSATSSDQSDALQGQQQRLELMAHHVNDQQLEVGEIIDGSSAAAADVAFVTAAAAVVADTPECVNDKLDSGGSSSSVTSFDLQLSTVGGGRGGGKGSDESDDKSSVSGFWT